MGKWTIELFGFPISFDWFSLVLPVFFWLAARQTIAEWAKEKEAYLVNRLSILTMLLLLGSVIFHELGHAIVAVQLGVKVEGAGILPMGAYVQHEKPSPASQLLISLSGPVFQFLVSFFIVIAMKPRPKSIHRRVWLWVAYVSAFLGLINLLPIGPLDGNRAFVAMLTLLFGDLGKLAYISTLLSVLLVLLWIKLNMSKRLLDLCGVTSYSS